jgi:5-methyltetrahydropteroyltriglutamate--homocysteine methyltransferase
MKRSTDRILTTHVGSLPRPPELIEAMVAEDRGDPVDREEYDATLKRAVAGVVARQVELGIDCVDDGEFSKRGFAVYAHERLGGLTRSDRLRPSAWAGSREALSFPEFYEPIVRPPSGNPTAQTVQMVCTGPIVYRGEEQLQRDLANLKAAVADSRAGEAFVPAISAPDVAGNQLNEYYDTDEEFLYAIADAMNVEYRAIVDAGFVLQIDDPRLVNYYIKNAELSVEECRAWARIQVEAINHSLRGIPEDLVRYHTCYGINMGPRVHDMEMKDILDIVLEIRAGAYSFEFGNPRHEHEWRCWENVKLADGKSVIPGVITHSSLLVEHPELIADRLMRFASIVGRENVIAGGDCGFGTQAMATPEVHPSIVWAKFEALVEGARIASERLWS